MANRFEQFDEPGANASSSPAAPAKPNRFAQFSDEEDAQAAADAEVLREMAMSEADYDKHIREKVRAGGMYRPQPGGVRGLLDQGSDVLGLEDEITGAGEFIRKLVTKRSLEEAKKGYSSGAERIRAERRVAREKNGWLGTAAEIIGGLATGAPARIGTALTTARAAAPAARTTVFADEVARGVSGGPALTYGQKAKEAIKAGGTYGAVTGATNAEGGALERAEGAVEGGLLGAGTALGITNVAAPVIGGLYRAGKSAARYGREVVDAARNPESAAIKALADQSTDAGLDFGRVRAAISPPPSPNLAARGFTEADMADVISRQMAGETADSVAASYAHRVDAQGRAPTGKTMQGYLRKYETANPTPMNLLDIAVEQQGYQGAMPMLRRARANYGIAPDQNIAQALENRNMAQPGRTADIIQQSGGGPRAFEDEVGRLRGAGKVEEDAAYGVVRKNAQPIDLMGAIGAVRRRAAGRQGKIAETMNKAADLFFEPELRAKGWSPMLRYRANQVKNQIDAAYAAGDQDKAIKLTVKLNAMRDQADFANPLTNTKIGKPITSVNKFLDARDELDQMITDSFDQFGKPTKVTAALTEFRTQVNGMARRNNPELTKADKTFYDNRSAERIIKDAQELATNLNPKSREAMRSFGKMTANQQELFRVSFEQKMADNALRTTDGNNAARRFQSEGFRRMIDAFYPASAGAEVRKRGQDLIKNLGRETITGQTSNFITGKGNSPTAPWMADMNEQMSSAAAAADVLTGRPWRALQWLGDRLTKQIGSRAAAEQLRIVAETDPAKLLPLLNELEQAALQSGARKQLVHDIRAVRNALVPALGGQVGRETAVRVGRD